MNQDCSIFFNNDFSPKKDENKLQKVKPDENLPENPSHFFSKNDSPKFFE